MMKIVSIVALLLSASVLASCASHFPVSSTDPASFAELDQRAIGKSVTVRYDSNSFMREATVEEFYVDRDSARWSLESNFGGVPTRDLRRVTITSSGLGALEGLGIGALGGVSLGVVLGLGRYRESDFGNETFAMGVGGVVFGALGIVGGTIGGAFTESKWIYDFDGYEAKR